MSGRGVPFPRDRRTAPSPLGSPRSPPAFYGSPPVGTPGRRRADESAAAKRKLPATEADPSKCYILNLPDELLVQVLGWLDPRSMNTLPALSRRFRALLLSPHPFLSALSLRFSRAPYIRLHRTWAHEYTARVSLEHGFAGQVRGVGAEVGPADGVWVEPGGDRAVGWGDGRVVRFDLVTGKVDRNSVRTEVPCTVVRADGSRAVLGLVGGAVLYSHDHGAPVPLRLPVFDATSAGTAGEPIAWRDPHERAAALAWDRGLPNLVASAGAEVLLWDVSGIARNEPGRAVAKLSFGEQAPSSAPSRPARTVQRLIVDPKGHVVAALSDGTVAIWDLDLMSFMFRPLASASEQPIGTTRTFGPHRGDFVALELDQRSGRILYATTLWAGIYSLSGEVLCTFEFPTAEGELSAAAWDRDHAGEEPSEDLPLPDPAPDAKPPPKGQQHAAVALGTVLGTLLLYDLPPHASAAALRPRLVLPLALPSDRPRTAHLAATALLLVSAHSDGRVHVRSVLSGRLLKSLSVSGSPRVQRAIEAGQDGVTCLAVAEGRGRIVGGVVGGGVKVWAFGDVVEGGWARKPAAMKKKRSKAKGRIVGVYGSPKQQALADMRSDLTDLDLHAASDRQYRRAADRLQGEFTPERGWSEEELLHYTIMLSMADGGADPEREPEEWDEREDPRYGGDELASSYESVGSWGSRNGNGRQRSWKLGSSLSGPTSPGLRPMSGPTSPGLRAAQASPRVGARSRAELEDEELQFALQLSLVEK